MACPDPPLPLPADADRVARLQAAFDTHLMAGRVAEALEASRGLLAALPPDDPIGRAAAEAAQGAALLGAGEDARARRALARARTLLGQAALADRAQATFNFAVDCHRVKRFALARACFRRAIAGYGRLDWAEDLWRARVLLAHTLLFLGDLDGAGALLLEAGPAPAGSEAWDRTTLHQTWSAIHLGLGRPALALESLADRFQAARELGDPRLLSDALYRMALAHFRLGDTWAAEGCLAEAQGHLEGLGLRVAEARHQALLRALRPSRRPASLARLSAAHPLRRCS